MKHAPRLARHHVLRRSVAVLAIVLAALVGSAVAQKCRIETEPNDVLAAASPLSDELTLRGTLWPQDLDLLSFAVDGDGTLLPMGVYTVRVPGSPPEPIRDVRVPGDTAVQVTLDTP